MQVLVFFTLALLLSCAPSRKAEPVPEPQELRLDTTTAPAATPEAAPHLQATPEPQQAPAQPAQPRRTPAAKPTTTAPAEGVGIRTEKKPRTSQTQATQPPAEPTTPQEEGGVEIRTTKKRTTP